MIESLDRSDRSGGSQQPIPPFRASNAPPLGCRHHIHFVGVAPAARGCGLGRRLYERFFVLAREAGRVRVGAITAPVNTASIAFHRSMGFTVAGPVDGYDGPGKDMMVFDRAL